LSANSVGRHLAALRFFYIKTLRRAWSIAETLYPKRTRRLPVILSREVAQLIRAPLNVDRTAIVRERLAGLSLTEVAKKHRVSRATVCRLVNESGRLKKTGVPQVRNQGSVIPLADGSDSQVAA